MKKPLTRNIALSAALIALATGLSALEQLIPVQIIAPVPGVKLGLANIVTMFALLYMGVVPALCVASLRCVISALLFSGFGALPFSLTGALCSLAVMWALRLFYRRWFSLAGISMAGAAAHNTGQILAAAMVMRSDYVFAYLPVLLLLSVLTGLVTALICSLLFSKMERAGIVERARPVFPARRAAGQSDTGVGGKHEG